MGKSLSKVTEQKKHSTLKQKSALARFAPKKLGWKILWRTLGITIWVILGIIFSELLVGYTIVFIFGREVINLPVVQAIYSAVSYVVAIGVVVGGVCWASKETLFASPRDFLRNVGLRGLPTWTDIGLSVVGLIVALILAAILTNIFAIFPWFDANESQDVGFNSLVSGGDRLIAFVTLVVVAPIAEEILFRGFLYGRLREIFAEKFKKTTGIILPILITSLAFGIVHLQWNVGVTVFALSVVMCLLRETTGSIYAGILMHMLKNGLAFYLLYVLGVGF